MSCYLRYMRGMFDVLDLEYDKDNRKLVDTTIRATLGLSAEETCSQVWAAVKALPVEERDALTSRVSEQIA